MQQSLSLLLFLQQNAAADSDNDDDDDDDDDTSGGSDNNACDQDRITLPDLNPQWSCGVTVTRGFTCAAGIALYVSSPPSLLPHLLPSFLNPNQLPLSGRNLPLCLQYSEFLTKFAALDLIGPLTLLWQLRH